MTGSLLILVAAAFIVVMLFLRPRGAQSGTYADLASRLAQLKSEPDPDAFVGFCKRGEEALYFIYQGGSFLLDYELSSPKTLKYEGPFRNTAAEMGLEVVEMTRGMARLLRVGVDDSEMRAAEIGFQFAQKMFGHDEKTVFEFLP